MGGFYSLCWAVMSIIFISELLDNILSIFLITLIRKRIVTAYFLMLPTADDVLLLVVIFATLTMVAYAGKMTGRIQTESACAGPGVITGSTLTLSGLLIGFVFSVSLSGYSARGLAELQETQSVASAWQYTILLPVAMQREVQPVLRTYLDDRIHFFPGRDDPWWAELAANGGDEPAEAVADGGHRSGSCPIASHGVGAVSV
jgi:hypothetical protein